VITAYLPSETTAESNDSMAPSNAIVNAGANNEVIFPKLISGKTN
jgi:hypothetical protein